MQQQGRENGVPDKMGRLGDPPSSLHFPSHKLKHCFLKVSCFREKTFWLLILCWQSDSKTSLTFYMIWNQIHILCVTLQNVSHNFKSPIGYNLCCLSCKKQMLRWCGIFAHFCARLKLTVICRIKDAKTTQPEIWFASSFFSIFNSNTINREKDHISLAVTNLNKAFQKNPHLKQCHKYFF